MEHIAMTTIYLSVCVEALRTANIKKKGKITFLKAK